MFYDLRGLGIRTPQWFHVDKTPKWDKLPPGSEEEAARGTGRIWRLGAGLVLNPSL